MIDAFFKFLIENRSDYASRPIVTSSTEKKYTRNTYILLPPAKKAAYSLHDALQNRFSPQSFVHRALDLQALSNILGNSIGHNAQYKSHKGYGFPSGGGFYAIETYVHIINVEGVEPGVYHYSSKKNAIACIRDKILDTKDINAIHGSQIEGSPALLVHMTMKKAENVKKYGSFAYALSLMEAGHRGQNITLSCSGEGVGVRMLGGADYSYVHELLGINGDDEHFIYGCVIGTCE